MDVLISTSAPEAPLYPEPIGLGDTTPRALKPKEIEISIQLRTAHFGLVSLPSVSKPLARH